ncbi:MAG TPA: hypothetical protein VF103_07090 [Polyangiaceae bacterium]
MAESKQLMVRLDPLERESREFKRALVQITDILVDQSERIDALGKTLGGRIDELGTSLGGRLDRLIAVTIQERTYSFERLVDIERRLAKLEEHAGF